VGYYGDLDNDRAAVAEAQKLLGVSDADVLTALRRRCKRLEQVAKLAIDVRKRMAIVRRDKNGNPIFAVEFEGQDYTRFVQSIDSLQPGDIKV